MSKSAILLAAFAAALYAQSTSTVTGLVSDASGAAVPNAAVVIRAVETGVEHRTRSNSEGYYTAPSLLSARYTVSAEFEGFQKAVSAEFKLDASSTARVDLVLRPKGVAETVEVTSAAPVIQTEAGMTGGVISEKEVELLPLNGRNTLELALTVAGVGGETGSDEGGVYAGSPAPGVGLSVLGGRNGTASFLSDGVGSTSIGIGRATVTFSPDTVQEFKVLTSSFSAQYGSTGGGVISAITKSGTSEYRGTAYWYHRNASFNARQFNSLTPPKLRRHDTGLTFGGPIRIPKVYDGRQRTFFFFAFEPKRWADGADILLRMPTAEERQGDFRNMWTPPGQRIPLIYRQVECWPSNGDCQQLRNLNRLVSTDIFPLFSEGDPDPTKVGRVIPKQYLDPTVQKLLQRVPMPNMPYDTAGNNYVGRRGVKGFDDRWTLKIDQNLAASHRLSGRYSNIPNYTTRYLLGTDLLDVMAATSDQNVSRQAFLSHTWTVTPRIVNEARAGYTFGDYSGVAPGDLGTKSYTKDVFGLPAITDWGYPQFAVTGWFSSGWPLGLGDPYRLGLYLEHQYQFADDVTMTFGRHTITTGVDWRFMQLNNKSSGLGDACCGQYNFSGLITQSGNATAPGGTGGLGMAHFLLGVPSSTTALRAMMIPYYYRWRSGAAYFQDDFKLRKNFTLNLGVRWQYNSPRAEKFNRQAGIDLDNPVPLKDTQDRTTGYTVNYVFSGFNGSRYLERVHKRAFEPRFGFAWTPGFAWNRDKTVVIRGGYGITHIPSTARGRTAMPDLGAGSAGNWNYVQWTGSGAAPRTQTRNPENLVSIGRNQPVTVLDPTALQIPADGKLCVGCIPRDPRVPTTGDLIYFDRKSSVPYVQSWNLTVQAGLTRRLVATVSYLGQKGTHLYSPRVSMNTPDQDGYQKLLDQGQDPLQTVPDPFGRVTSAGLPLNVTLQDLLRPYPTVGAILLSGLTDSTSIYHSASFELERRFTQGFGFRFNYTFSKSMDSASDNNGAIGAESYGLWGTQYFQNTRDLAANRSVSPFDQKHRLNFTMNAVLPFGRGKLLLRNSGKAVNAIVGGWTLNAIGRASSGLPFAPVLGDMNGIPLSQYEKTIHPDIVTGVPVINPRWNRSVANSIPYVNPELFARPAYGHYGNAARVLDWVRMPWTPMLNLSLLKDIYPFENRRRYIQLRGEFFNAINHTYFQMNPSTNNRGIFNASMPSSRTGLNLAGPVPYFPDKLGTFPAGSRESYLATYYLTTFGVLSQSNNAPGRQIQVAVRVYF